jgi:hypothetical protein
MPRSERIDIVSTSVNDDPPLAGGYSKSDLQDKRAGKPGRLTIIAAGRMGSKSQQNFSFVGKISHL